jgi:hypothetical protein
VTTANKHAATITGRAAKKPKPRRARGLSPADIERFSKLLTAEEAEKMIRDTDEAYEQIDVE